LRRDEDMKVLVDIRSSYKSDLDEDLMGSSHRFSDDHDPVGVPARVGGYGGQR